MVLSVVCWSFFFILVNCGVRVSTRWKLFWAWAEASSISASSLPETSRLLIDIGDNDIGSLFERCSSPLDVYCGGLGAFVNIVDLSLAPFWFMKRSGFLVRC
ncbi:hypothetical protein V8F06_013309, partial [Rhypophila decipiens]